MISLTAARLDFECGAVAEVMSAACAARFYGIATFREYNNSWIYFREADALTVWKFYLHHADTDTRK